MYFCIWYEKDILHIISYSHPVFRNESDFVYTFFCGEVADIKVSFLAEDASCGMENSEDDCQGHTIMTSGCCRNELSRYNVEDDFYPQQITSINFPPQFDLLFSVIFDLETAEVKSDFVSLKYSSFADLIPDEVKQEEVCVFII